MKVRKITTQPEFQPVTLQITIESQEELDAILEFSGSDYSIATDSVIEGYILENQKECIIKFLGSVYEALK